MALVHTGTSPAHCKMNIAMFKVQILISDNQLKQIIPQKSTIFVTLNEYKYNTPLNPE